MYFYSRIKNNSARWRISKVTVHCAVRQNGSESKKKNMKKEQGDWAKIRREQGPLPPWESQLSGQILHIGCLHPSQQAASHTCFLSLLYKWFCRHKNWLAMALFEPTCAYCTMGSYASLSVCLSLDNNSLNNNAYLKKYYRYTAFIGTAFIGTPRKNTNYTLRNAFLVNKQIR